MHCIQKRLCASCGFILLDSNKDPAGGSVNGHKQVAAARLIGHLGQVLHIHVQVTWLVALERLVRLLGCGRFERMQVAHAVAA